MMTAGLKISIIIVNYNVKDFLEQAIESVSRALKNIPSEIIVVDNNSIDGSVQMIRERFPDIKLIASNKNLGFSGGNNLALKQAAAEYIVLLNPDTVVQEDTFTKLLDFFDNTPDASAATCKILNPNGTFSIDCRHSIPTPSTAFWKLIGFNRLFPKSRIFGRYNLTYLNENDTYAVEAISGSFMMIKNEIVQNVGLLDETFFMYCEDIDYCYRINQAGGKIYYVPDTQIVHYKGESSKANNLDYVITFNRSLYQFYKKHYQQKYVYPFKWLILLGVILRGFIIYFKNFFKQYYHVLIDLIILNTTLFLSFYGRYEYKNVFRLEDFFNEYIVINFITSVTYLVSASFFDIIRKLRFAPDRVIKVLITTFFFVAALTFFLNQFAFSRFVVLLAAIASSILMIGWRMLLNRFSRYGSALEKEFIRKKALIVGDDKETADLLEKLNLKLEGSLEISGVAAIKRESVGKNISGLPIVTSLDQLEEFVSLKKTDIIIFSTHNLPYEMILGTMSRLQKYPVEFKMVPGHLEFMIGKSNIERLHDMPLVDIDYAYAKIFNRFSKRLFDVIVASFLLFLFLPVFLVTFILYGKYFEVRSIESPEQQTNILWNKKSRITRMGYHLFDIIRGRLSFVGAPIIRKHRQITPIDYKPGITGILQINEDKFLNSQRAESYELHYLKNQSIFLDIEILIKAVLKFLNK
ncbi:MAG: glycosyltransferase [Calditrichaeota bacterium]|nr:glycosyltransferase [Calditrichota bacterium]